MPDWLNSSAADPEKLTVLTLLARLVVALVCGLCVAVIYRLSHGRDRAATTGLVTTLVLLSVLISLVSIVIGSSVARAFSLVGALSIVRFRTVVEDTRDTAFVIFTVVVGMAAGAGLFWVAPLGLLVVGVAAVSLSHLWDLPTTDVDREVPGKLMVRVAMGQKPGDLVDPVLNRYCDQHHIHETSLWKQGTGLELIYVVRLKNAEDLPQVVVDLSQTEGILGVELKRS
ncbi:MAG: DUF4956 domain-containing protein [Planctomycetaceae bacterium]|jgi:uncharacterized membrane protein YhiD involved in acid resistance